MTISRSNIEDWHHRHTGGAMRRTLKPFAVILLINATLVPLRVIAQQSEPEANATLASGTLNIILANKNGFVIATDSRMSADAPFQCEGRSQLYCDNSQKLFRTTSHSAMAIAGFAVGRWNTPLDLALAPVLRRTFGPNGLAIDEKSDAVPQIVETTLEDALIGMAAIHDPRTPSQNLSVTVTFARFDHNHVPVLQQMLLVEAWRPMGPLQVPAPQYSSHLTSAVQVTKFFPVAVGISCVADAILAGIYKSDDPLIQDYYRRRTNRQLDDMALNDMSALARVILRETRKFTDYVGGDDQIAQFPAGGSATFHLPNELPTETQTIPRVMRWEGLLCTSTQTPPCGNPPMSFSLNSAQPKGEVRFTKFLLASQFKNVPVALDDNLFVADSFDGVTLKWNGSTFFSYRNTFNDCVLETTMDAQVSRYPELATCRLVRKTVIELPPDTVGLHLQTFPGPSGSFSLPRDMRP
jgi:hypothetical protein